MIKVAVIGCGTIANAAHLPGYQKNKDVQIAYCCDIIPERAQRAVEQYDSGQAVTDYHVILNDPTVKAVSICTPNNIHAQIAMDCMRAGKHVLCEKPAARTYQEALEMQKIQHETGITLNIGVVNRFNDAVRHIKQHIDRGELGEIYQVYVSFRAHRSIPCLGGAFTTKSIAGGGALIDWGVHYLDIVMFCCGDPKPRTVSGEAFCRLGRDIDNYTYTKMWAGPHTPGGTYDVEDSVTALIRTEGPVITLNGAWAQNIGVGETYIDFLGDKAGIRLQYGGNYTFYTAKDGMLQTMTPSFISEDMFQREIDEFVLCVQNGRKLPSHIDTVILTAQIMQAIYDSSDQHKEINLK